LPSSLGLSFSTRTDGRGESHLFCPSKMKALVDDSRPQAKSALPLGYGKDLPLEFDVVVVSRVVCLLNASPPRAVGGFIVAVVIESVQRVGGRWFWPHVFKKSFKILPSFAHANPTASPVSELRCVGVLASAFHVNPGLILTTLIACPGSPMLGKSEPEGCSTAKASARERRALSEVSLLYILLGATVAVTSPIAPFTGSVREMQYNPPTVSLTAYV
jgi:hypothetical protein